MRSFTVSFFRWWKLKVKVMVRVKEMSKRSGNNNNHRFIKSVMSWRWQRLWEWRCVLTLMRVRVVFTRGIIVILMLSRSTFMNLSLSHPSKKERTNLRMILSEFNNLMTNSIFIFRWQLWLKIMKIGRTTTMEILRVEWICRLLISMRWNSLCKMGKVIKIDCRIVVVRFRLTRIT